MLLQQKIEKETSVLVNQNVIGLSGRMSLGMINGQANETVYIPEHHKLSELNWDIRGVYMLGLGGSIAPLPWMKMNADVWLKMNKGTGTMEDYDWMLLDFQYTHLSTHDNLDLTRGVMFDINAELTFYEYSKSKFYGILGFKHDTWEWKAYGGDYIYSTYSLYDTRGSFEDGVLGITYEQNYYTPYIGVGFSSALSVYPVTFSGRLIGSVLVSGEAKDQHHMRDLVFEDEFDSGTMFAFDFGVAYDFTDNLSLQASYRYQKYEEERGGTTTTDLTTGRVAENKGDVAGMEQYSDMFSLTLQYSF